MFAARIGRPLPKDASVESAPAHAREVIPMDGEYWRKLRRDGRAASNDGRGATTAARDPGCLLRVLR